jgi:hypothetical protein
MVRGAVCASGHGATPPNPLTGSAYARPRSFPLLSEGLVAVSPGVRRPRLTWWRFYD